MAKVIKRGERHIFYCPGCEEIHSVDTRWSFNSDLDSPTFSPSIDVKTGHYARHFDGDCWCTYYAENPDDEPRFRCNHCHSFVRNGSIEFLSDSSHSLAGKTVPLPGIDNDLRPIK